MKKLLTFTFIALFLGIVVGCGSSVNHSRSAPRITVLERIPARTPSWVRSDAQFSQTRTTFTYRGISEGFTSLNAAKRAAEASAKTRIAEHIKSTISAEFVRVLESQMYDATTGGYLRDIFISSVDRLEVSGIIIRSTYSEKIAETSALGERIFYRSFALAELSRDDFQRLVDRAFSSARQQTATNQSAREALADAEQRFRDR